MNDKLIQRAEKEIRVGIKAIRDGNKTVKDAGLGKLLNALKTLDEPLYIELIELYKKALKSPFCKR